MEGIPHIRYNNSPRFLLVLRNAIWPMYALAIVCGVAQVGAFAPFGHWWLLFPSILFLLWIFDTRPTKTASRITFVYGWSFWLAAIHWITNSFAHYANIHASYSIVLVALLSAGLALFWVLLLYLYKFFTRNSGFYGYIATPLVLKILVFAASWSAIEWLRSSLFGGFPWLLLGYALMDIPYMPLHRYLPIGGILLLGFLGAISIGACYFAIRTLFAEIIIFAKFLQASSMILITGLILTASFLLPATWSTPTGNTIRIALVQPSIPLHQKWSNRYTVANLEELRRLSFPYRNQVDIILWPESAIADLWQNHAGFLSNTVASLGSSQFVSGSLRSVPPDTIYNSIIAFSERPLGIYDKRKLVPFGEFVPLFGLIGNIITYFGFPANTLAHSAQSSGLFSLHDMPFTVAICYEIIFSSLINHDAWQSEALLNISDDGWFGNSIGPHQHFQMARARTMEQSRPLVRVGNDGITALIDHQGKIVQSLARFAKDVLVISVEGRQGTTPYSQIGDWLMLIILIPFVIHLAISSAYRRRIE